MEVVQAQSNRKADDRAQVAPVAAPERSQLADASVSTTIDIRADFQRELSRAPSADSTQPAQTVERRDSIVTASVAAPVTEKPDSRLAQMQQKEIQEKLVHQETMIRGTESNIESTQKDASTGGVTGFFMWSAGTKGAMNKDIASMQELNEARNKQASEMKATIEKQQKTAEQFAKLEQQGKELQAKGDLAGAQKAFNAAQEVFNTSQGVKQPGLVVDTAAYREQQQQVQQGLSNSVKNLDTTESVMRTTQKVAIVAGATIATGGAALAVGGVTGAAVGVVAGTAYGTAVGGTAALTEATGHVARGNKTESKAFSDAGTQTLESARDSAIASVGTVAGMGVGGHVAGGVAARLGTSAGAQVATAVANGAAAGASSAAFSTSVNTGLEYSAARREFSKLADSANLSPADREVAYAKFMEDRGLSTSGIAQRFEHDVSIGALGGGIGGATGAGKQLATSGRNALAMEGGQALADVGIGVGDAALRGQLNAEGITSSIAGAVVGNVSGRVSQRNHPATKTQPGGDQTPPPTTVTDGPPPEIYRMEDYRQQQTGATAQPHELQLAAGAESMSAKPAPAAVTVNPEVQDRAATIKMTAEKAPAQQANEVPATAPGVADADRHPAAPVLDNAVIDKSVNRMLADTDHQMDLTRNLQHAEFGPAVKSKLEEISAVQGISQEEFVREVAANREKVKTLFPQDDTPLNVTPAGESRMRLLREDMMKKDPILNSIGDDATLTPAQRAHLDAHADKIKTEVLPNLQAALEDVTQVVSSDSYVRVTSRAKSADGLHEKVTRMQDGNQGRGTRPEYRLADVPDAVGGRVVVENAADLGKITAAIEEKFQGNIFEKDNFYLNEKKSQRPYRVITYTVLQDGVPCEIQVMTLASNISSDIDHNTVYKQLIGLDDTERQQVTDWWRGVAAKELNDL